MHYHIQNSFQSLQTHAIAFGKIKLYLNLSIKSPISSINRLPYLKGFSRGPNSETASWHGWLIIYLISMKITKTYMGAWVIYAYICSTSVGVFDKSLGGY